MPAGRDRELGEHLLTPAWAGWQIAVERTRVDLDTDVRLGFTLLHARTREKKPEKQL